MEKVRTIIEQRIWKAWNALPEECMNPVKTIAGKLEMRTDDVALVVFLRTI